MASSVCHLEKIAWPNKLTLAVMVIERTNLAHLIAAWMVNIMLLDMWGYLKYSQHMTYFLLDQNHLDRRTSAQSVGVTSANHEFVMIYRMSCSSTTTENHPA